jgi:hypothetical protein
VAWDNEATPSPAAEITVVRLPEADVLKSLRFNGVAVVTDGWFDPPVLGSGSIVAEVDPRLPFRATSC